MAFGGLANWFKKRLDDAGNVASRVVAQANPLDNGRTFSNNRTQNNYSAVQQVQHQAPTAIRAIASPIRALASNGTGLIGHSASDAFKLAENVVPKIPNAPNTNLLGKAANSLVINPIKTTDSHVFTLSHGRNPYHGTGKQIAGQIGQDVINMASVVPIGRGAALAGKTASLGSKVGAGVKLGAGAGASFGGAQGVVDALKQNKSTPDIIKAGAGGAAIGAVGGAVLGAAAPTIGSGVQQVVKGGANVAERVANKGLKRPSNLTDQEVTHLQNFRNVAGTGRMMDDATYQNGIKAAQKAGIKYTDNKAIDDLLGAHRTFDTRLQQRNQKLQSVKERLTPTALDTSGGGGIGDTSNEQFIKNPITGETVPNPKYKPANRPRQQSVKVSQQPQSQNRVTLGTQPKTSKSSVQENVVSDAQTTPINTDNYNISGQSKQELNNVVDELAPEIEKKVGRKLSLQETQDYADATNAVLSHAKTREATMAYNAKVMNARQEIANLVEKRTNGGLTREEANRLGQLTIEVKAASADAARTLGALRQVADPKEKQMIDIMIERLVKKGHDIEELTTAMNNFDLNDPKQAAEFYRMFEKATAEDWLDKYRYTNMLGSPMTHLINMSSNATGVVGVAPVQKLYEGGVDAVRAAVTGGERTRFAGESGSYLKGVGQSLPEAATNFANVMRGASVTGNPDMDSLRNVPLASKGLGGVADKVLTFIPKLLEASDQFFTTLARGGEEASLAKRGAKGVTVSNAQEVAQNKATYRLFRNQLGSTDQGHLLNAIDAIPQAVNDWRKSENPIIRVASKFTFPFVATPVNILKQGIEYTPAGVLTLTGNADKTAQVAKMAMGMTAIGAIGGLLAAGGDLTFGEPKNADERNRFRADGKQPYAFNINGKWFSYQKLHPAIAFNFALVAGVKQAIDSHKINDSQGDIILQAGANMLQFFTDQSYMKNVGDTVNALSGKDGGTLARAITSQAGNAIGQVIPFHTTAAWVGRMIDPVQRKVDTEANLIMQTLQQATKDVPGLTKFTPPRLGPDGQPIKNQKPILNNFSPVKITSDKSGIPASDYSKSSGTSLTKQIVEQKMTSPEEKKFLAMTAEEQKNAANQSDSGYKMYQKKQDIEKQNAQDTVLPRGMSKTDEQTLHKVQKMTDQQKEDYFYKDKSAEYAYKVAQYERDKKLGKISTKDRIKKDDEMKKLKVGTQFNKESRDLWSLSKDDLWNYLSTEEKGKDKQKIADEIIAYDDALTKSGVQKKNKFRDKYGNITLKPKDTTGGGGRKGRKGAALASISLGRPNGPRANVVKVSTGGAPSAKLAVPKGVRVGKAKVGRVGGGKIRRVNV